ncbi:MAG: hypothetical protein IKZ58_05610 [Selenomonadaceae bacterium]|nr:hypothetical protein [Selenomonadaceae bacterium]
MAKFGLSGIADALANQGKKTEEAPKKTGLSGIAAALANQSNKAANEAQNNSSAKPSVKPPAAPPPKPSATPTVAAAVAPSAVQENVDIIDASTKLFSISRDITLAGVLPGIAFSKMVAFFGEPIDRGDFFTFDNGLTVEVDSATNIVKKISVISGEIVTPEGVAVDMKDVILNTTYATADEVDVKSNGADYKYFNKNKTRKYTFIARDGYINKIVSELI